MPRGRKKTPTRASLESFNRSVAFRSVYDTVCGGTTFVFVAFALSLGLAKERMGFVTTLVSLACALQMVGLLAINRAKDKKRFVIWAATLEPLALIAAVVAAPFLPAGWRIPAMAAAVFMAAGSLHLTRPMQDSWLATTIPAGIRGRYLGRRFQVSSVSMILSLLAAGFVMERIDRGNSLALAMVLVAGGAFGLLSVQALHGAVMPPVAAASRITRADLLRCIRLRPFRRVVLGTSLYMLAFAFAVPYYQVVNLEVLQLRESVIAGMLATYHVIRILVNRFCGKLVDRKGPRWAGLACGPAYALFFAAFLFADAARPWPVIVGWALVAAVDSLWSVAMFSALYAAAPPTAARPAYFAVFNMALIGVFGLGALLAVPVLGLLDGHGFAAGPFRVGQFQLFYAFAAAVMVCGTAGALLLPKQPGRQKGQEGGIAAEGGG